MPKLKITQEQYNRIIIREQEARLKASGDLLTENLNDNTQLLEEGWREVVLGVAMMMGVGLTGQNKLIAQDAVKNANTMAQVKATLEDEDKTKELVDAMKEKGMKDPSAMLSKNAEKVIDKFNEIANDNNLKYKVDVKAVNNLQALSGKLGQGYALKKADISTDTLQGAEVVTSISMQDTIDVELGSDNLFVTGGFTLSPSGIDTIKVAIEEIKKQGGKILNIEIESSTDAEEIPKFKNESDPTGNIKLAELRTKSVADMIGSIENGVSITHREIPNNGANIVSTQEFTRAANNRKALLALRDKTSEFRYVKLKIVAIFEREENPPVKPPDLIKNYRFELVKVIETTGKSRGIKSKVKFKHKKFKCNKGKKGNHTLDKCFTF